MRTFSSFISVVLSCLLISPPVAAHAATPDEGGALLQIRVLDGTGSTPDGRGVAARSTGNLLVEVKDPAGLPVANAAVIVHFPEAGTSASFPDGTRSAIAYTDQTGHAQLQNIKWSDRPGIVSARLTASSGTAHAGLLFEQNIVPGMEAPAPAVVVSSPAPHFAAAKTQPAAAVLIDGESDAPAPAKLQREVAELRSTNAEPADVDASNVPIRHLLTPGGVAASISITSTGKPSRSEGHGKLKWIIAAAAVAGAGAAFAMLHKGSSGNSSSGISVGSPTVSVGHP